MLANVLRSEHAMKLSVRIIEIFIKMRELLSTHKDILLKLEKLENNVDKHGNDIQLIFKYIKSLLNPPDPPRRKIGFRRKDEND